MILRKKKTTENVNEHATKKRSVTRLVEPNRFKAASIFGLNKRSRGTDT